MSINHIIHIVPHTWGILVSRTDPALIEFMSQQERDLMTTVTLPIFRVRSTWVHAAPSPSCSASSKFILSGLGPSKGRARLNTRKKAGEN